MGAELSESEHRNKQHRHDGRSLHIEEVTMTDDKNNAGSPDRDRINVNEDYELQYWTKALGVSAEELRAAVKAVGPTAAAVRRHLGK
ncbi:hypothetical protein FHT15_003383 [Xanthomonas campestris]